MTATSTLACTTPNCPNPAIGTLPIYVPGDEHDHVCGPCLAAYWAARESAADDYS
ncbi:hypothetical protein F5X71_00045 [Nocardia brasiliensis]|uniref:Uncharacterized protein n=1 Tax=Nocardia brasiliensis TaxID=37326 RepID=A0A6G9XJ49_NOCBR|nr:hypothetical protein [Nocardia brasiliensis]QIS00931.1 hypothetical protein F5X71_00045 [Nocardia brasiliensis]